MTPKVLSIAAALVLSARAWSTASAEVEDVGRLPTPIANDYIDQDTQVRVSYDADDNEPQTTGNSNASLTFLSAPLNSFQIPDAVVDFGAADPFIDQFSFGAGDVDTAGAKLADDLPAPWRFDAPTWIAKPPSLSPNPSSELQIPARQKPVCSANPPLSNIVNCELYSDDPLLRAEMLASQSHDEEGADQKVGNINSASEPTTAPITTFSFGGGEGLMTPDCANASGFCYPLIVQASGGAVPASASPTGDFPMVTGDPLGVIGDLPEVGGPTDPYGDVPILTSLELGTLPTTAPEAPSATLLLIGLAAIALARTGFARCRRFSGGASVRLTS